MARNGCKKVLIVNGHGGNEHLLPYFAQAQLAKPRDSVVYVLGLVEPPPGGPPHKSTVTNWHAGESETSQTMVSHPDLVHLDRAASESGADLHRLSLPDNVYTGTRGGRRRQPELQNEYFESPGAREAAIGVRGRGW